MSLATDLSTLIDSAHARMPKEQSHVISKSIEDFMQTWNPRTRSMLGSYFQTSVLAEQVKGTKVTVNNVDPGIVRTQMVSNAPGILKIFNYITIPFSVSPEKGAATSIYLASSEEVNNVSGNISKTQKPLLLKTNSILKKTENCSGTLA